MKCSLYSNFSISCVKLTIFLRTVSTELCEQPLSRVLWLYFLHIHALSQWETGRHWLCGVAGSWLPGVTTGRIYQCHLTHTHTHTHTLTHTHTHRGMTDALKQGYGLVRRRLWPPRFPKTHNTAAAASPKHPQRRWEDSHTHLKKLITTTSKIQTKRNCCIQYIDDLWLVL